MPQMELPTKEELQKLTFREREVLKCRLGLDGYKYTQEETGRIFRVTRTRIANLERKALEKIQDMRKRTGGSDAEHPEPPHPS